MNLDSPYSLPDLVRLCWSYVLTRILFRPARIIRQPCRIRGYKFMQIGHGFTTGQYCRIEAGRTTSERKSLIIGRSVQINDRCHIAALNSIEIGDNVLIASNVFITDHDHGDTSPESLKITPSKRPLRHSPVKIEDNVWIGQNAIILKGVTIGESSIIAAGSVVTRDIPPFCVAAGIPAVILKQVNPQ
jgi:acetyltransferase-like isoleucine patch superfamily enzyme